jgi:sugar lactone lactonase YvrE
MTTTPPRVDPDRPGAGPDPEVVGATLAHHGEGAVWDDRDGSLLWLDITGRCVHRTTPAGVTTSLGMPSDVGAVVPYAPGGLLAAVGRCFLRVDLPTGDLTAVAETPAVQPAVRMNDGGTDPAGRFWAGTMGRGGEEGAGTLYRLDGPGAATAVIPNVSVPNGPVWSPGGDTMYFTDTPTEQIRAYDYDRATGELGADRVVVDARELSGQPDGMTVDADGNLWVAFWDGWAVRCFSPAGELLREIGFPVARPTRPTWGGPDASTLYVTTSRFGLAPHEVAEQPLAGRLFAATPGPRGLVAPAAARLD